MALAPTIIYTVLDGDNDDAVTGVHVPIGDTLARYTEFAVAHAETIEGMILGVIQPTAQLGIPVDISALINNIAADTSDVEQIAAFQFADAEGDTVDLNVPCLNPLDVSIGTDALNLVDVAVADVITMMEDGLAVLAGGGATIIPCNIAEADLQAMLYARKETRNSGRRR